MTPEEQKAAQTFARMGGNALKMKLGEDGFREKMQKMREAKAKKKAEKDIHTS